MVRRCVVQVRRRVGMDLSLWLVVLLHLWHWTVELLVELHHSLVLALDETIVDFVGHVSERDLVDRI